MPSTSFTPSLGVKLQILTGQDNYAPWLRDFRLAADHEGVWDLYDGSCDILAKPDRNKYLPSSSRKRRNADAEIAAQSNEYDADDIQMRIAEYKLDCEEYKENEKKVRTARTLLAAWVDPSIRGSLQEQKTPKEAFDFIHQQYRMTNARALEIALSKMERLKLKDCKSMQDYLYQITMIKLDITDAKGTFDDQQLQAKICRGLTWRYNTFVDNFYLLQDEETAPNLKGLTTKLLTYESKLSERDEQKQSQKPDNKYKDKVADGEDNPKKSRPKCTYEPCQKWGHLEKDCRTKKFHEANHKENKPSDDTKPEGRRRIVAIARGIDMAKVREALAGLDNDKLDNKVNQTTGPPAQNTNEARKLEESLANLAYAKPTRMLGIKFFFFTVLGYTQIMSKNP